MFSKEKYENVLFLVISPPDLLLTAPKMFNRPMLNIVLVSESPNLPFTANYYYLQVDL